jgi:hypothetical protein
MGSPWAQVGLCTLPLSGHKLCPLWVSISPKPFLPVPAALWCFCTLYPPPHVYYPCSQRLPSSLVLYPPHTTSCPVFPDVHNRPVSGLILVILVLFCLLLVHPTPRESQWELMSCLAVPSFFLYKPKFSADRLLCLLHASCRFLTWLILQP